MASSDLNFSASTVQVAVADSGSQLTEVTPGNFSRCALIAAPQPFRHFKVPPSNVNATVLAAAVGLSPAAASGVVVLPSPQPMMATSATESGKNRSIVELLLF